MRLYNLIHLYDHVAKRDSRRQYEMTLLLLLLNKIVALR